MRKYIFLWNEENNSLIFEPTKNNPDGKRYELTRENIVTYHLDTGVTKITSNLDGCIEYVKDKLEKEDCLSLASMLYSWGQYIGARM